MGPTAEEGETSRLTASRLPPCGHWPKPSGAITLSSSGLERKHPVTTKWVKHSADTSLPRPRKTPRGETHGHLQADDDDDEDDDDDDVIMVVMKMMMMMMPATMIMMMMLV